LERDIAEHQGLSCGDRDDAEIVAARVTSPVIVRGFSRLLEAEGGLDQPRRVRGLDPGPRRLEEFGDQKEWATVGLNPLEGQGDLDTRSKTTANDPA